MTTKQILKDELAGALAVNQRMRSTALAAALFPLIDAFELVGRGHGIQAVNNLPTTPSAMVPDVVLLAQADGDRPAGLYYRVASSGDWINAYRMVTKENVASLAAADYFNLLAYETAENDEGLFFSNGVRWIRLTRNRLPGWQEDWQADTPYVAGDTLRFNSRIQLCVVGTDGDPAFPAEKFLALATGEELESVERRALSGGPKPINDYLADEHDTTPFRIYQANGIPGITAVEDLDGDYLLVFKNPAALLSGAIAGAPDRIDELRVFITNGGLSQTVHRFDPWTYGAASEILEFNISDAEESSVVASITGNSVEFTVRAFLDNGAVGTSLNYSLAINPAFRAPAAGGGDVTTAQFEAEQARRVAGDRTTFVQIANLAGLDSILAAQATNDESFEGQFTAEVTKDADTYVVGQVIAIAPRSQSIERKFIVGAGGAIDATARGAAAAAGNAAMAAREVADANKTTLDNMPVFANYALEPPGIGGIINLVDLIVLRLTTKTVNKTITRMLVSIAGTPMADVRQNLNPTPPATDPAAPFNDTHYQQSGGIINLTLRNAQDRNNLITAIGTRQDDGFIEGQIDYTFSDGTAAINYFQWLIDSPALRPEIRSIGPGLTLSSAGELSADQQGGSGSIATPASAPMVGDDRFVFVDVNDGNALKRTQSTLTAMIDRFRSGMAEATGTAKGLLSAALFNKLTALPTRAELTTEINNIGDLRTRYSQAGTPVAADRFYFTDENQPDDPFRYVQYRDLAAAIIAGIEDGTVLTGDVAASADTENKLWLNGGRLYRTIFQSGTAPTVTYRDFTQTDWRRVVNDNNAEWGGVKEIDTPANQHGANYGEYSIPAGHFNRRIGAGFPAFYQEFYPPNWRNHWPDKATADEHVTAVGDVVYYDDMVRVVATFRAGSSRGYRWIPIEAIPAEASVTPDKIAEGTLLALLPQLQSQDLTFGAVLAWDLNEGYTANVTLTGNATLGVPTNSRDGDVFQLVATQDGTGSRTLALNARISRYHGVAAPVLTTDANAVDHLIFANIGGTVYFKEVVRVS